MITTITRFIEDWRRLLFLFFYSFFRWTIFWQTDWWVSAWLWHLPFGSRLWAAALHWSQVLVCGIGRKQAGGNGYMDGGSTECGCFHTQVDIDYRLPKKTYYLLWLLLHIWFIWFIDFQFHLYTFKINLESLQLPINNKWWFCLFVYFHWYNMLSCFKLAQSLKYCQKRIT